MFTKLSILALASAVLAQNTTSTVSPCASVYNSCIQAAVQTGGSPNFAVCNAASASCAGTVSATPAPTATPVCSAVYNSCIQSAVQTGGSPNFAVCNAAAAACSGSLTATKSVAVVTKTVESFVTVCPVATVLVYGAQTVTATAGQTVTITACPCVITSTMTTAPAGVVTTAILPGTITTRAPAATTTPVCSAVYNSCIQAAVQTGGSPNFAVCNASAAACSGSLTATRAATSVPVVAATTTSRPIFTGAANANAAGPAMGLLALGALAIL